MNFKKSLLVAFAASLVALPVVSTAQPIAVGAVQRQQIETERLVSLGGSLTAQQAEQTKQLLGAANVPANKVVYVDGDLINRFLQDGSNSGTQVFSSALIEKQAPGFGVQVQIVTPQNITLVKPVTYQNAAITSGAKDVLIKIATVTPVTGEGALAGVYALLERSGVKVDQKAVKVAEKEIKIVEQVKREAKPKEDNQPQVTDNQVNKIISDIKKEVTINVTNNTEVNVTQIVQNIVNNNVDVELTEENVKELEEFASDFAQTEAAQDEATVEQLEKSIDLNLDRPWADVLSSIDQKATADELKAMERKDYSDRQLYHEIIPALFERFYDILETKTSMDTLYSHTFIVEKMLPNLTAESKQALNQLRVYIFQYTESVSHNTMLREEWLHNLALVAQHQFAEPIQYEIIQRVAFATGLSPEVFEYSLSQVERFVQVEVRGLASDYAENLGIYQYSPETNVLSMLDELSGEFKEMPATYNFNKQYNVDVKNEYVPMVDIPSNYSLNGQLPMEESLAESTEATENTEQSSDTETSQEVEEQPTEEETTEESSEE